MAFGAGEENPAKLSDALQGESKKLMRALGLWEAGEGNGRHGDAVRGGGSVRMTLSVARADIPIAVVTLATASHGAAQAGHGAQGWPPSHLLTFSGRFGHRRGVFVLPQLQAAPKRDQALSPPAAVGQEWGIATGQRDGPWGSSQAGPEGWQAAPVGSPLAPALRTGAAFGRG